MANLLHIAIFIFLQSLKIILISKMKKIVFVIASFNVIVASNAFAQKAKPIATKAKSENTVTIAKPNPLVFSFANETVMRNEFDRLLNKNRKDKAAPTEKEVREYLDLYINFKLKVKEAVALHLDTNPTFVSELAGYRKQLAAPYLTDKKVTDDLINEAYDRMKHEVNASHILIMCSDNASPADTLAAYNKLADLKKRYAKGENFDSLASKYSEDPSAKRNFGSLGWFGAFNMVYPFETQAYKTAKGDVSAPFRTQFGYHIMKVNDKRAARGDVKVAHIMVRVSPQPSETEWKDTELKADSIYQKLMAGETFEAMVEKYSQDEGSKPNKGVMNWMASLSGYPENFKDISFALKENEVSKPFRTDYGYHIIKLIERRPLADFKEMQDVIKTKITKDSRSQSSKAAVITRIKKDNNYKEFQANVKEFASTLDSSFTKGTWTYDENKIGTKTVLTIGDKTFTQKDFAAYVKANQAPIEKGSALVSVLNMFKSWSDDKCMAYEESMLDSKYEDFNNVYKEYHDGILLFDLTDKKVWSKAVSDTLGLEKFYENNKGKYMWKERVHYQTFTCLNAKAKEEAIKMLQKGKSTDEIQAKLNKKVAGTVSFRDTKSEKTDATAEKLWDKKGLVDIPKEGENDKFYWVIGNIAAENKTLKEAKGLATSDYQNYLEKEWIKELRAKYPVQVNEETLRSLYGN